MKNFEVQFLNFFFKNPPRSIRFISVKLALNEVLVQNDILHKFAHNDFIKDKPQSDRSKGTGNKNLVRKKR